MFDRFYKADKAHSGQGLRPGDSPSPASSGAGWARVSQSRDEKGKGSTFRFTTIARRDEEDEE